MHNNIQKALLQIDIHNTVPGHKHYSTAAGQTYPFNGQIPIMSGICNLTTNNFQVTYLVF